MMRIFHLTVVLSLAATTAAAQEIPADYASVLKILGRQGDYKANVLKVNIPRSDLKVSIDGISTPTPFGFGGWLAMTKGEGGIDVMMGDLVLQEDEVNPVMSALLSNDLEVTASQPASRPATTFLPSLSTIISRSATGRWVCRGGHATFTADANFAPGSADAGGGIGGYACAVIISSRERGADGLNRKAHHDLTILAIASEKVHEPKFSK